MLSASLYNLCKSWLPASNTLEGYIASDFASYLWMMFGITSFASLVLFTPPLRKWVEGLKINENIPLQVSETSKTGTETTRDDSV